MCKKAKEWIENKENRQCKQSHRLYHFTAEQYKQDNKDAEDPTCRTCKQVINVEQQNGIYHCQKYKDDLCKLYLYHKECHESNLRFKLSIVGSTQFE